MNFLPTELPGVLLIEPQVFSDERGFFQEIWQSRKYADADIATSFVQDNHSRSVRGCLRGLHLQLAHSQGKLVHVARGEVFDVVVDVRKDSPYFGKWISVVLSDGNHRQLWVPPGLAHGFYVLSEVADVVYKCTDFYAPQHEVTLRWDDPDLDVPWPLVDGRIPMLSGKDAKGLGLNQLKELL